MVYEVVCFIEDSHPCVEFLVPGKARRLKQAKEEAQAEIDAYKTQREKQYREHENSVRQSLQELNVSVGVNGYSVVFLSITYCHIEGGSIVQIYISNKVLVCQWLLRNSGFQNG